MIDKGYFHSDVVDSFKIEPVCALLSCRQEIAWTVRYLYISGQCFEN